VSGDASPGMKNACAVLLLEREGAEATWRHGGEQHHRRPGFCHSLYRQLKQQATDGAAIYVPCAYLFSHVAAVASPWRGSIIFYCGAKTWGMLVCWRGQYFCCYHTPPSLSHSVLVKAINIASALARIGICRETSSKAECGDG
jgi:hypothetical protein